MYECFESVADGVNTAFQTLSDGILLLPSPEVERMLVPRQNLLKPVLCFKPQFAHLGNKIEGPHPYAGIKIA